MIDLLILAVSFVVILAGAELFTNGIEWFGRKLGLAEGAVGSVLAAVGVVQVGTLAAHDSQGVAIAERQLAGATVAFADDSFDPTLLLQAINHPTDGGPVVGNQFGHRGLIGCRVGLDGIECGKLHRGQVKACGLRALGEHLGGLLVQPTYQVPRHVE